MKANELRIGNEVLYNGKPISISIVGLREFYYLEDTHANSEIDKRCYEPILLTEEWLLKFGFEKDNTQYLWRTNLLCLDVFANKDGVYFQSTELKYVHQLQNLYFALTGTELEIKETVTP